MRSISKNIFVYYQNEKFPHWFQLYYVYSRCLDRDGLGYKPRYIWLSSKSISRRHIYIMMESVKCVRGRNELMTLDRSVSPAKFSQIRVLGNVLYLIFERDLISIPL